MLILVVPSPLPTVLVNVASMPPPDRFAYIAFFVAVVGTLASISVAIFTGWLASSTKDLSVETMALANKTGESIELARETLENDRAAMAAEQERHMDGFMPHLALLPRDEKRALQEPGVVGRFIVLYVRNIGVGFAQNINIVHFNTAKEHQFFVYASPIALGVGDEVMLAAKSFNNTNTFMGYTVTYEDAFGRTFESVIDDNITTNSRYRPRRVRA